MSKGRDTHQQRLAAVAGLGRQISKRARSCCELCGDNTSLQVVEVAPVGDEPSMDRAVMVCERCAVVLGGAKRGQPDASTLRFLEGTVWSEVLPAQLAAVRATRALAADGVDWATELLDGLYLDEETEALLAQ